MPNVYMESGIIEVLLSDNWKRIGNYTRYDIMAKGADRKLYCPVAKKIIAEYKFKKAIE